MVSILANSRCAQFDVAEPGAMEQLLGDHDLDHRRGAHGGKLGTRAGDADELLGCGGRRTREWTAECLGDAGPQRG